MKAGSACERVLALQPDNAQAHNNLANTCKRLGLLDQAEQYWMQALALQPNYAEPYSNLANLLNDRGDYDKAAEYGRRAIELNPQLADAYINLSGIETARQRHGDALRWLNALLSFAPMHAGGLAAQALVLKQLDELPAALDAAQLAVSAAPENPETHNALGQVLQALGRFEPALAAYDRAATLPGTARETALLNRAASVYRVRPDGGGAGGAGRACGRRSPTRPAPSSTRRTCTASLRTIRRSGRCRRCWRPAARSRPATGCCCISRSARPVSTWASPNAPSGI